MYHVKYDGVELQNSPFSLTVVPKAFDGNTSRVTGLENFSKDRDIKFKIELKDEYENHISATGAMAKNIVNVTAIGFRDHSGDYSLISAIREDEISSQVQMCVKIVSDMPFYASLLVLNQSLPEDFCVESYSHYVACSTEESNHATIGDYWEDWIHGICSFSVSNKYDVVQLSPEVEAEVDGSLQVTIGEGQVTKQNFRSIKLSVLLTLPDGTQTFAKFEDKGTVVKVKEYDWYPEESDRERGYTDKERIIYLGLTSFLMTYNFLVVFLVWFWRKENAIKFSQRNMLNLFLFGCFLATLGFWLMGFKPIYEWKHSCGFQVYLISCGCLLGMLVMLAKLYRVNKLAYAKANQKVVITDKWLFRRIGPIMFTLTVYFGFAFLASPIQVRICEERKTRVGASIAAFDLQHRRFNVRNTPPLRFASLVGRRTLK